MADLVEEGDGQDSGIKRTKHRSPNYPMVGLRKAVDRVKQLHDKYKRAMVPINLAQELWNYTAHGSAGNQCVAALKSFGLLDLEGDGKGRRVRVSEPAYRIVLNSPDRGKLLKGAMLAPSIYTELFDRFAVDHFPPELMKHYLLFDREDGVFNPEVVDGLIENYLDGLRFSGHLSDDIVDAGAQAEDDGDGVEGIVSQTLFAQPTRATATPSSAVPQGAAVDTRQNAYPPVGTPQSFKEAVLPLQTGAMVIRWPEQLSAEEVQDFEDWIPILIRKMKRAVQSQKPLPNGDDSQPHRRVNIPEDQE